MALDVWTEALSGGAEFLAPFEYMIYKESEASISHNDSSATIEYLVSWDDGGNANNLQNFLTDVLGYSYLSSFVNPQIKRVLPHAHFDYKFFYATTARVEGMGACLRSANGGISYPTAKVIVDYRPRDYLIKKDEDVNSELQRYVTRKFAVSGQYLSVQGTMQYVSPVHLQKDGIILPTQPGKIVGMIDAEYTWVQIPTKLDSPFIPPNLTAINNCLGKVNSTLFDPTGLAAPPGTVLFEALDPRMSTPSLCGPTAIAKTVNGGQYYFDIVLKFKYLNNGLYAGPVAALSAEYAGHNYIYRVIPDKPSTLTLPMWDLVTANGQATGARIYGSADLNTLFTVT